MDSIQRPLRCRPSALTAAPREHMSVGVGHTKVMPRPGAAGRELLNPDESVWRSMRYPLRHQGTP
jgi:hypothetical protein